MGTEEVEEVGGGQGAGKAMRRHSWFEVGVVVQ